MAACRTFGQIAALCGNPAALRRAAMPRPLRESAQRDWPKRQSPAKALAMTAPSFLTSSLLVAIGGGGGAWARYLVGRTTIALIGPVRASDFPYATLTVNVVGSFAMGLLAGWLARHGHGGENWRLLL